MANPRGQSAEISLTWRTLLPTDRAESSLLLDRAFNLSAPASYLDDFPVWNPDVDSRSRCQIGGFSDGHLRCTASIRFVDYRFPDGGVEAFGLIGAVATHPDFAGRGLASEMIRRLVLEGENRGTRSFALWGSESSIYRTHGFLFGGKQTRIPLVSLDLPKTIITGYEIRTGWESAILNQFLNRESGVLYQESDQAWLSRHANVDWRSLWRDGKCLAYCAWNRGIDLPNMIHELGGDPGATLQLLHFVRDRYPMLEWMTHADRLSDFGISTAPGRLHENLAQFRVSDAVSMRLDSLWFSGMDAC